MINNNLLRFRTRLSIVLAVFLLVLSTQTALAEVVYQNQVTAMRQQGNEGTSLQISVPSGTAAGDLLLAVIVVDGNRTVNTPTGLTSLSKSNGNGVTLAVFYRVATGSETSYTFSWGANEQAAGAILRYTGVDTSNPINAVSAVNTGSSNPAIAPATTTTVDDTMVVRIAGVDNWNIGGLPATGRVNLDTGAGYDDVALGVSDAIQASAGSTGSASFDLTAMIGGGSWRTITIALAPFVANDDWGDAPDSYGTDSTNDSGEGVGPSHTVVTGLQMGTAPDAEGNGVPGVNADGDDNAGSDDEDGVSSFATLTDRMGSQTYNVTVAVNNTTGSTATLVGWIDFDGDDAFQSDEAATATVPGDGSVTSRQLSFTVPTDVTAGQSYARFRFTTDSITTSETGGSKSDGEVEDYPVTIAVGGDWGDAPDSYGTTSGASGPSHTIVSGLEMGSAPDAEGNGVPGANADGDDTAGSDDEDGVSSFPTLTDQMASQAYNVTVAVTNTTGSTANLIGWIDFDINGTFDSNEAASTTVANGTTNGSVQLVFTVPDYVAVGQSYARFRLTTDSITTSETGGSKSDGEVEDYAITIADGGEISGHVFRDYDADGASDANEPGVAGITVTAYDVTGTAVVSGTTDANGDYTLAGLADAEEYRIEFTDLPSYLQPGPCGTDSETTVTFATSPASSADVGLANPAQYCQNDPKLVTSVYRQNDNTGSEQVLGSFDYTVSGRTADPATEATASQIGTTYGLAYQRSSDTLFAAAYQKRHAGYGSADSTGAIYQIPNPGDGSTTGVSLFVDLNALYGTDVAGENPHSRDVITTTFEVDGDSWDAVGKVAFGDMDISEDELSLWTVNLNDRQLYRIPLGTDPTNPVAPTSSAQIARYPLADPADPLPDLPTSCTGDENYVDIRPFATKVHDGLVYVGLVCSGESTRDTDTLKALAYSFNPDTETFALVLTFPLTYTRGYAMYYDGVRPPIQGSANWNYWEPYYSTSIFVYTYQSSRGYYEVGYAQPMFSDIEFDDQGNMLIGLRDRFGDQFGYQKPDPNGYSPVTYGYRGDGVGDILRATPDGNSGWTLSIAEATDGTEFFPNDYFSQVATHDETSEGGLAVLPGQGEVALSIMDPIWDTTGNWAGGVAWMNTSTGARPRSYQVYDTDNNGADSDTFGKGNGLGDLEALCDPAPIEIGNRVWDDTDFDGIQDPEEANIAGVEVQLWADTDGDSTVDTQVGTATTDANGNYYFGGINDTNMTGDNSVEPNTAYELRISLTDPALPSGAVPAPSDQGTDLHDSDGVIHSGYSTVQFTTGAAGANNHTYDFGFDPPPTTVTLSSFIARPVSTVPTSQGDFSFWPWVGLAGLAVLAKGQVRRVARKVLHQAQPRHWKAEEHRNTGNEWTGNT